MPMSSDIVLRASAALVKRAGGTHTSPRVKNHHHGLFNRPPLIKHAAVRPPFGRCCCSGGAGGWCFVWTHRWSTTKNYIRLWTWKDCGFFTRRIHLQQSSGVVDMAAAGQIVLGEPEIAPADSGKSSAALPHCFRESSVPPRSFACHSRHFWIFMTGLLTGQASGLWARWLHRCQWK